MRRHVAVTGTDTGPERRALVDEKRGEKILIHMRIDYTTLDIDRTYVLVKRAKTGKY